MTEIPNKTPTVSAPVNADEAMAAPEAGQPLQVKFTRWRAPSPVTKRLSLSENGELLKDSTAASLSSGSIDHISCTPESFAKELLPQIGPNECLSFGIPKDPGAQRLATQARLKALGPTTQKIIARTAEDMRWPEGPGILMLDYDPPKDSALGKVDLLEALYTLCPALRDSAHIWATSASSCIVNTETGEQITGIRGQRVYIVVKDAHDIPRAGEALYKRSWLAGHGWILVSKSGQLLDRGLVDRSVFQPNRIDFCAPPICESPLISHRPMPELLGKSHQALDTAAAILDLTTSEEAQYAALVEQKKSTLQTEATVKREQYIAVRLDELVKRGIPAADAETYLRRALTYGSLEGDFPLISEAGEVVTVREVLQDCARWHLKRFADPIEPTYRQDRRIATAYLLDGPPRIFSYAHGRTCFRLNAKKPQVFLEDGARNEALREVARYLKQTNKAFRIGQSLCSVDSHTGRLKILNCHQTMRLIDETVELRKPLKKGGGSTAEDSTEQQANLLIHSYANELLPLKTILNTPGFDPVGGTILREGGYYPALQALIFETQSFEAIPDTPTLDEVCEALATLWGPVRLFPYVAPVDASVMLTALLTAAIRPLLPTAPAFAMDAPLQGSGKTLGCQVIGALAGSLPTVVPPVSEGHDDEIRKTLLAALHSGAPTLLIDNITGEFDSPALASFLTSECFTARILQKSEMSTFPNRILTLLSGNNLTLKGDLPRRVLVCRIDPASDTTHQREFPFHPLRVVEDNRQVLVAAAITILRAAFLARTEQRLGQGRTASFELWDDCVRQSVCWLAELQTEQKIPVGTSEEGRVFPALCDPNEAIVDAIREDPERIKFERFLVNWVRVYGFGSKSRDGVPLKTVMEDLIVYRGLPRPVGFDDPKCDLHDTLVEVGGDSKANLVNPRSLGKWLHNKRDRVIHGICLRQGGKRGGAATWYVEDMKGQGLSGFDGFDEAEEPEEGEESETAAKPVDEAEVEAEAAGV